MIEFEPIILEPDQEQERKFHQLYNPAYQTRGYFKYFTDHPFAEKGELFQANGTQFSQFDNPELVSLVNGLISTRGSVRLAYSLLAQTSPLLQKKIPRLLYESAQRSTIKHDPSDIVEMDRLDNPYAITCLTSRKDFEFLDSPDSYGYFYPIKKFSVNGNEFDVNFVAFWRREDYLGQTQTRRHEITHSWMAEIKKSFKSTGMINFWGEGTTKDVGIRLNKLVEELNMIENMNFKGSEVLGRAEMLGNEIIRGLLSLSKDELLTRMITGETIDLELLKDRESQYNKADGLNLSFDLGDKIWDRYRSIISREIDSMLRVYHTYNMFGLEERRDLLPWMLTRVPLGKWTETLNEVGLTNEAIVLEQVDSKLKNMYFEGCDVSDDRREEIWKKEVSLKEMLDPQVKFCKSHNNRLLLPFFDRMLKELKN